MQLAHLPDHNRTTDLMWLRLWTSYAPVITPLRALGLVTDVELCGGEYNVTAALPDGSYFAITSTHALPVDPADVTGWTVQRLFDDNPTRAVLYDSTEDGQDAEHGNALAPMLGRIVHWMLAGRRALHEELPGRLGELLANLDPGAAWAATNAPTPAAKAAALEIKHRSETNELPPTGAVHAAGRGVTVMFAVNHLPTWAVWCELLHLHDISYRGSYATAFGTFQGVTVKVIADGVPALDAARNRARQELGQ
ncbi:hypothetical protein [Streptomyces beijiangensis]|uniref:Uncharacterized protein n=1 Tax=Streptomyces beijiangensis TaxID=163361 RepID=A0A939FFV7_9ACTN|nr:hypothetical protein [Streptomyces beijiangensis]MBO0517634.1 hypothetical protein [Streptomyces beijiangensis]